MNIYLEVILRVLGVIGLSVLSAILYRLGGASTEDQDKEFPFIPRWFKNIQKKRDAFANSISLLGLFILGVHAPFWAYFISFGLLWMSLSSYFDWAFGYDNHYMHGFACGMSVLPLAFYSEPLALGARAILMCLAMGVWSKSTGDAFKEETGRGFFLTIFNLLVLVF